MNNIAYLSQIEKLNALIECKESEIQNLKDIATTITATLKDDCVQRTEVSDKVGKCASMIADMENELEADMLNYLAIRSEILGTISQLDSNECAVLYRRYFELKSWGEIANEMHYSRQSIYRLHKEALQNLQKII